MEHVGIPFKTSEGNVTTTMRSILHVERLNGTENNSGGTDGAGTFNEPRSRYAEATYHPVGQVRQTKELSLIFISVETVEYIRMKVAE